MELLQVDDFGLERLELSANRSAKGAKTEPGQGGRRGNQGVVRDPPPRVGMNRDTDNGVRRLARRDLVTSRSDDADLVAEARDGRQQLVDDQVAAPNGREGRFGGDGQHPHRLLSRPEDQRAQGPEEDQ